MVDLLLMYTVLIIKLMFRDINFFKSHRQYVVEPGLEVKSVEIQGHTLAFLKELFDHSQ
jgi:hypothetical protein